MNQMDLFISAGTHGFSISEASNILNVSEASIRNWIKSGLLEFEKGTGITKNSFENFSSTIAGKEKLNKRANKSQFDSHNHSLLMDTVRANIKSGEHLSSVSEKYEYGLSNSYRNKEGIYYTPKHICSIMFSDIPKPTANQRFCDPCCGSGNFMVGAIRHGFRPENVFGYDTDPMAVEITKKRIYQETGFLSDNIVCRDFLEHSINDKGDNKLFDIIATNPPWGKKLSKNTREEYGAILGSGNSIDTSSLFMFASLRKINDNGFLAFLMPEAFFKISTFKDARERLLDFNLISVRDFGRPFKGLLSKAQSFCVSKSKVNKDVLCVSTNREFKREQNSFLKNPIMAINVDSDQQDETVISKIYSRSHITLRNNARWGLGIVTGNNKRFCKAEPSRDLMPVYKGADINKGWAKKPEQFIPKNLALYQQVAPVSLYEENSKLLYRFISSELVFFHDTDKSYFLNSVNMMVLNEEFSSYTDQIVKLFNTDLYSWIFSKIFNTHKVLRSDLEKLPIPMNFFNPGNVFEENELLDYYGLIRCEDGTFRVKG